MEIEGGNFRTQDAPESVVKFCHELMSKFGLKPLPVMLGDWADENLCAFSDHEKIYLRSQVTGPHTNIEILCHEVAHLVLGEIDDGNHGPIWQGVYERVLDEAMEGMS